MIRLLYRPETGPFRLDVSLTDLPAWLGDPVGLIWLDMLDLPYDEAERLLRETFGFHPLAIEDALSESHSPKIDDWDAYLYIVLRSITFGDTPVSQAITTPELDIFLGDHFLVTYRIEPLAAVDRVWELCQRDERQLVKGPDHIVYLLADEMVNDDLRFLEQADDLVDQIEEQIFRGATDRTLADLFDLKRSLLTLRRHLSPQREVLNKLARDPYAVIDPADRIFFRDVYDHLVRLVDLTESLRDLVAGAMDTYLSVMNNRMNDIMKTLTVITTLFMPLTFLTGFFGMNFFAASGELPGWTREVAFSATLIGMLLIPAVMFLWMRRRAWM